MPTILERLSWLERQIRLLRGGLTSVVSGGGSGINQLTGDVEAGPGTGSQVATITDDAVTTVKILDEAVTNAKLADMAQATIKGRADGAGTGVPTDLDSDDVSDILDTAADPFVRTSEIEPTFGSLADYGVLHRPGIYPISVAPTNGNFTVGTRFSPNANMNITGAEFYINGTAIGKNVKVKLWTDAGVDLSGGGVTVNSVVAGGNIGTFASPVAVTAGTIYVLTMYVTDGTKYMVDTDIPASVITAAISYYNNKRFVAGDAFPTTTAGSERYPINPTIA